MMDEEFNSHMGYDKHDHSTKKSNYWNGSSKKSSKGISNLSIPRDSSFEPAVVEKHTCDILNVGNKIINLYVRGMSTRDISKSIHDIYGIYVSASMIKIKSFLKL